MNASCHPSELVMSHIGADGFEAEVCRQKRWYLRSHLTGWRLVVGTVLRCFAVFGSVWQCVFSFESDSVLQCMVVWCSVSQCVSSYESCQSGEGSTGGNESDLRGEGGKPYLQHV